jgi:hypothetical protein
VQVDGKRQLLMSGTGASPEGNKPFLDLLDVDSKETTRLWQSSPPYLESVGSIMSDNNDVSQPGALLGLLCVCMCVCTRLQVFKAYKQL